MNYDWNFSFIGNHLEFLASGIVTTVSMSALIIIISTLLGTLLGIAIHTTTHKYYKMISIGIIDIIRSIPLLIFILLFYYTMPILGLGKISSFWIATATITIYSTAFWADIIKGSISGVAKGAILAGRSLGFSTTLIVKNIILPEVYREVLPSLVLVSVETVKATSLSSIIVVYEITHVGEWIIADTFKPLEVYTMIAIAYMLITLPMIILARKLENSDSLLRRNV